MSEIIVTPLSEVSTYRQAFAPRQIISLIGQDQSDLQFENLDKGAHTKLILNDITTPQPGFIMANQAHVETLINIGRQWDQSFPLLIHCWMGISRSTAAAYIIACALADGHQEQLIAQDLRLASPTASPNIHLVALADALLKRDGAMIAAIQAIGRGMSAYEGVPFHLDMQKYKNTPA